MATQTEITATYENERFRFENNGGDVIIGAARMRDENGKRSAVAIKGPEDKSAQLLRGHEYRFFGRWSDYTNKRTNKTEKQFHFDTYVTTEPAGREAVVAYLLDATRKARKWLDESKTMGIGPSKINKLWEAYGEDAVKMCREHPDEVAELLGTKKRPDVAEALAKELNDRKGTEQCVMELLGLFAGRGIPRKIVPLCLKVWGNRAAELVKRNPYLLMRFRGVGFTTADKMYIGLGHDPKRLKRLAYCVWHAIASRGNGNTWTAASIAVDAIARIVSDPERIKAAIHLAKRGRLIKVARTDDHGCITDAGGRVWLSAFREGQNETDVAEIAHNLQCIIARWPEINSTDLTDHQRVAIEQALKGSVSMLIGSPGCGKTYAAARIINAIIRNHGPKSVAVAAPTGKAAVRLTESLNDAGIELTASTIHSLLKVEAVDDGSGWSFTHHANNPLPFSFVVVDESSMIDVDLMASLLRACNRGTHLLFIGDTNQLPPVGHGATLHDFINAGLPCGELREILRNDGGIVQACADMRDGKRFECDGNLMHVLRPDAFVAVRQLIEKVERWKRDPVWDFQVIVPINEKSPVSRKKLNEYMQQLQNKENATKGTPFWPQDKVVNTQNSRLPELDLKTQQRTGEECYVANGELGEVIEADAKHMVVRLTSPDRLVFVPRGDGDGHGCSWDLGYALSCHRCQGSEWPYVAVVLDDSPAAKRVCDRSWIYTAISRAKSECFLVGNLEVAYSMCGRQSLHKRKTLLTEQINREMSRLLVDAI